MSSTTPQVGTKFRDSRGTGGSLGTERTVATVLSRGFDDEEWIVQCADNGIYTIIYDDKLKSFRELQ